MKFQTLPQTHCYCNCGEITSPGKRFISGHNSRVYNPTQNQETARKARDSNYRNGTYEENKRRFIENNPSKNFESLKKRTETQRKNGNYDADSESMKKRIDTCRKNGVYERFGKRIRDNPPMKDPKTADKIRGDKNPAKRPEVRKKISVGLLEAHRNGGVVSHNKGMTKETYEPLRRASESLKIWRESEEGKKVISKSLMTKRRNKPYWFLGFPFDSTHEVLITKELFKKFFFVPIDGTNVQIQISTKIVDFYFLGFFFEHHPESNGFSYEPKEKYYKERREFLDRCGFEKVLLIHTITVNEAKKKILFLYNSLKGYLGSGVEEFL